MNIVSINSFVPQNRISTSDVFYASGESINDAKIFSRIFGIDQVAIFNSNSFLNCARSLLLKHKEQFHPEAFVFAHGFKPVYTATQLIEELRVPIVKNVRHIYEVDSFNCVGLFQAIEVASSIIGAGECSSALILAGDDLSGNEVSDRLIRGSTIMGDALVSLVVSEDHGEISIENIHVRDSDCSFAGQMFDSNRLKRLYSNHANLVSNALDQVGFEWDSDELLIPHNINRLVWHVFMKANNLDIGRVRLDLLPSIGHCCTTDPFLILDALVQEPVRARQATLLSVGIFGQVGACKIQLNNR